MELILDLAGELRFPFALLLRPALRTSSMYYSPHRHNDGVLQKTSSAGMNEAPRRSETPRSWKKEPLFTGR